MMQFKNVFACVFSTVQMRLRRLTNMPLKLVHKKAETFAPEPSGFGAKDLGLVQARWLQARSHN